MIAMAVTFVAGLLLLGGTAFAADPPGNNGTVKIDNLPFDDAPNNEPHDGCVFQVDFYGFDQGDIAEVTFTAHPPTSDVSGPGEIILQDSNIDVGGDDHSGGGSEAGLDASETYSLDFSNTTIEPSANQGFHVKLTVTVTSPNSVTPVFNKHKVFWVQPCEVEETTTTTTTTSSSTTSTTTPGGGGKSEEQSTTTSSTVLGAPAGKGVLPFTGSNALPLTVAGLALLGLGAASLLITKRQRGAAK